PSVFVMPDKILKIDLRLTDHSPEDSTYDELKLLSSNASEKIELLLEDFRELYCCLLRFNFYQKWSLVQNEHNHLKKDNYFESLTIKTPELSHTLMESDDLSLADHSCRQIFQLLLTRFRMLLTKAEKPDVFQQAMKCY